ncbi:MAG: response regulator [Kiritimatiellaceae bacterium]|nr:response regulator [Kiritimatiellaceae bacterium]
MKIDYKILWIEDQPSEVEFHVEAIRRKLGELGFNLDLDSRLTISNDDLQALEGRLEIYNPYDLIIFDYDLGKDQTNGAEIAHSLRRLIYTDMIFYSSKPAEDMRKALFDLRVDGVYIVTRTDLHRDGSDIIEDQLKRICDLNNMRGVVLDEMSKLDKKLRLLLVRKFRALDHSQKDTQVQRTTKRFNKRAEACKKQADEMSHENFIAAVEDPLAMEYGCVRDRLDSMEVLKGLPNGLLDVLNKMQKLRNELAHQEATLKEEDGRIYLENSTQYKDGFGHAQFMEIRKELRQLATAIEALSQ